MNHDDDENPSGPDHTFRFLGDMTRLEVKPGDALVLSHRGRISDAAAANLQRIVSEKLPGHRVLVLGDGLQLAAVSGLSAAGGSDTQPEQELARLVNVACGEASMCWDPLPVADSKFQGDRCLDVARRLVASLRPLLRGQQGGRQSAFVTPYWPAAAEQAAADASAPTPIDLCRELREALGLPAGALPIAPRQAWEDALIRVRAIVESVGDGAVVAQGTPGTLADEALLRSTDAPDVWADQFVSRFPGMDRGTMIGWFANLAQTAKDLSRDAVRLVAPVFERVAWAEACLPPGRSDPGDAGLTPAELASWRAWRDRAALDLRSHG